MSPLEIVKGDWATVVGLPVSLKNFLAKISVGVAVAMWHSR